MEAPVVFVHLSGTVLGKSVTTAALLSITLLQQVGSMGLVEQAKSWVSSEKTAENGGEVECDEAVGDKEDELVPDWLWGGEDPANQAMPIKTLSLTSQQTVIRLYGLGRAIADVLARAKLFYWASSGTTLGIVRWLSFCLFISNCR